MSSPDNAVTLGDRYLLADVLGRGGMADVHRATDRLLGRTVAIKVLRDSAESESDRQRFTAEARTLAGLNHPGLVMVLDAGITAEQPYLVMELVEGTTLGQSCAGNPLDVVRVGEIGAQLADALAYAHAQGVVHRDVKPGNVLLGDHGRVKLADFGIARLIGDTVRHTKTGHAIGTPAYLAPEQVLGDEITPAVDVYSLGLVLLEALTGERAYPGSPTEAALVRLNKPPHIPEHLPEHWRRLLAAMTAMEPAGRPTATEVASALRGAGNGAAPGPGAGTGTGTGPGTGTGTATGHLSGPEPTATQVMSQPVPVASPAPAPATAEPSFIDRAGEALARQPGVLASRAAQLPPHLRAVAAVVVGLLLLIVIAGVAADTGDSSGEEVPQQTPSELRQPLQDLHDAVDGSGS